MHEASKRATRKDIVLRVGPVTIGVDVYSGIYTPPSRSTVCIGEEGDDHQPTKLVSGQRSCPVCSGRHGEKMVGRERTAVPGTGGELRVIDAADEVQALEVSEQFRDEMELVLVSAEEYQASALESGKVYWLSSGGQNELYGALAEKLEDPRVFAVTRWAASKNVKAYRVVGRGGLLGMIELIPSSSLRAAPNEPPAVTAGGRAIIESALQHAEGAGLSEVLENPHAKALARAADQGIGGVETRQQQRGSFEDTLAKKGLEVILEEEDF